jgi:hypothetical protein
MILSLVLLLAVMGITPAFADVERIPVMGERVDSAQIAPGEFWVTETPDPGRFTQHARNILGIEIWQGGPYLNGQMFNEINFDIQFRCASQFDCDIRGLVRGTAHVELDEFEGGWDGIFVFRATEMGQIAPSFSGHYIASGWGELEGWLLNLHVVQDGNTHTEMLSGYVYNPDA